jgi:hypothetical protein
MITNFLEHLGNGITLKTGEYVFDLFPDLQSSERSSPAYQVASYSWIYDGRTYTCAKDRVEAQSLQVTPNKKYLIVEQNPEKYGTESILILNPDGTERLRLKNPYPASEFFRPDAKYAFREVRIFGDRVEVRIDASWFLPKYGSDANPTYASNYDCDTWQGTPLRQMHSKEL